MQLFDVNVLLQSIQHRPIDDVFAVVLHVSFVANEVAGDFLCGHDTTFVVTL